jgi:hypothetical protein
MVLANPDRMLPRLAIAALLTTSLIAAPAQADKYKAVVRIAGKRADNLEAVMAAQKIARKMGIKLQHKELDTNGSLSVHDIAFHGTDYETQRASEALQLELKPNLGTAVSRVKNIDVSLKARAGRTTVATLLHAIIPGTTSVIAPDHFVGFLLGLGAEGLITISSATKHHNEAMRHAYSAYEQKQPGWTPPVEDDAE